MANYLGIIIKKEYLQRIKSRPFIILTLLAPFLYSLIIIIPVLLAGVSSGVKEIYVVDESSQVDLRKYSNNDFRFITMQNDFEAAMSIISENENALLFHIPKNFNVNSSSDVKLISKTKISLATQSTIESAMQQDVLNLRLKAINIDASTYKNLQAKVNITAEVLTEEGITETSVGAANISAYVGAFLIYFFVFMYGGFVFRAVQDEKQSRIVEVLVSSVKPFQLMMGKVIGIALVGLTQIFFWVVLIVTISGILSNSFISPETVEGLSEVSGTVQNNDMGAQGKMTEIFGAIDTLNIPFLLGMLLFYFLGGYLLFSAIYAAVAAAVDSQTDAQQFLFPIAMPVIISIISISYITNNPDSTFAFWMSMIPLTSPIVMMARLPFDIPAWQIILSMGILVISFIGITSLAAKIYRIGILMYGSKPTYKELWKWLRY